MGLGCSELRGRPWTKRWFSWNPRPIWQKLGGYSALIDLGESAGDALLFRLRELWADEGETLSARKFFN